ncbi:nucleoside phosphorylase [Croceiramulus getboli]|nr:nucleoside phosphorylase [Flavobacteriaceae bacterium YJPT1-3]
MSIAPSELILNPDGSIYHLHLHPEEVATTILTVGDPDRVDLVASYLDRIEVTRQKREFKTVTGTLGKRRLTIISTGIGTDNIDIVFSELDALFNIDFKSRQIKKTPTSLQFIRLGTSGAIQEDIPVDSLLISSAALGLDSLLHHYDSQSIRESALENAFIKHMEWPAALNTPYAVKANARLLQQFQSDEAQCGITVTNVGFYGPQGRSLRLAPKNNSFNVQLSSFNYRTENGDQRITNLEMETSGIYGMAALLGHEALSMNAILANRATAQFSTNTEKTMRRLIGYTLDRLTHS